MKLVALSIGAILVLIVSAQTSAQPPDPGPARAKQLKAAIKDFQLNLFYYGQAEKPFYRLVLTVQPVKRHQDDPFLLLVRISPDQAAKIVDHLASDGFLTRAQDAGQLQELPEGPLYVLRVSAGDNLQVMENLGWGLPMLKRLDALRKALDGKAAKGMDILLARLAGLRKEWEEEQTGNWQKLYSDQPWYKDHKPPEQIFTGTLQRHEEPEFSTLQRSHRYQLGDRFIYPGTKNEALERLVGKKVAIRGKLYDIELEGQALREIWPGAIRPLDE